MLEGPLKCQVIQASRSNLLSALVLYYCFCNHYLPLPSPFRMMTPLDDVPAIMIAYFSKTSFETT